MTWDRSSPTRLLDTTKIEPFLASMRVSRTRTFAASRALADVGAFAIAVFMGSARGTRIWLPVSQVEFCRPLHQVLAGDTDDCNAASAPLAFFDGTITKPTEARAADGCRPRHPTRRAARVATGPGAAMVAASTSDHFGRARRGARWAHRGDRCPEDRAV